MSKTDAFFDEYESVFGSSHPHLPSSFRQSTQYPHVTVRLCGSEYHPGDVGIDIDHLFADEAHKGQGLEERALDFIKDLATRHGLVLMSFSLKEDEQARFRQAGFVACNHGLFGATGAHWEWPACWHEERI